MPLSHLARITALGVALAAAISLGLQMQVTAREIGGAAGVGTVLWVLVRYFTVLTNVLVAAGFTWFGGTGRSPAGWAGGLTVWIVMVGAVYHTVLAALWRPVGLAWWADQGLHTAVPVFVVLWWVAFAPKSLMWRHAIVWIVWPVLYVIYALVRGRSDGIYPYPFIDAGVLSAGEIAVNTASLLAGFAVLGLFLVAVAMALTR